MQPAWGLVAWAAVVLAVFALEPRRSSREERPDGGAIRPAHLEILGATIERAMPGGRSAELRAERLWTDSKKVRGFKIGPLLQYRYRGFELELREGDGARVAIVRASKAVMAAPGEPIELSEPRVDAASGRVLLAKDAVLDLESGRLASGGFWALWEERGSPARTGRGFEASLDMSDFRERGSRP